MRNSLLSGLAVLAALAIGGSDGAAGEPGSSLHPSTRVICLDVGGETRPVICRGSSSRLDQSYSICHCENAQRVEAPVCAKGERPLPESREVERVRKLAAQDGSLVGDSYQGRRMCVRARNS